VSDSKTTAIVNGITFTIDLDDEFVDAEPARNRIGLLNPHNWRSLAEVKVRGNQVFINDKRQAVLGTGETKTYNLPCGNESIQIQMKRN
jgi:uncharacterized lipoprotein YbaY